MPYILYTIAVFFFQKSVLFCLSFLEGLIYVRGNSKLYVLYFSLTAVIKFEGGTDFDLQVLDDNYKKPEQATAENPSNDTIQRTNGASQPANDTSPSMSL